MSELESWALVGIDSAFVSMTVVAVGYDAVLDQMRGPTVACRRWTDEHYFLRLADAARAHELVLDALVDQFVPGENTYIAVEEPWYFGAVKAGRSGWLKQQAEIAGAVKGSLLRWGYRNLHEVNSSSWQAVVRREAAVKGKLAVKEMKWVTKAWAIEAYGIEDLPDLVPGKRGGLVPRPQQGFGAKAEAVQPNDAYDCLGILEWLRQQMEVKNA